jgi:pimeloyl-ACP methyl ester carboxylesterase
MPEKYVHRDGIPILVRHTGRTTLPQNPPELGAGPTVLCLHDAGLQSSVFLDLMAALAPSGAGIAFDLPGHGRSGSLDSLPSIGEMTEMAQWVADWCQANRPILVGHGMGALLALEWARTRGDSLGGLVLCGAGLALGIESEAIETMRQVTRGKAPRPFDPSRICKEGGREMMQRAYMEGIRTDPRATLVDLEASRAWSDTFLAELASQAGFGNEYPIAIVHGAAESPACRKRAEALADSISGASVSEIADAAHFLPLEQPAALANEIRRVAEAA